MAELANGANGHGGPVPDGADQGRDGDAVLQSFPGIVLKRNASDDGEAGTLEITDTHVHWTKTGDEEPGLVLAFPHISMHAIIRATEDNPAAVYLQVAGEDSEFDEEEEEEEEAQSELWFVPADPEQVDALFKAFSEGALRNPDASDDDSDGDDAVGICLNEDEVYAGADAALLQQEVEELEAGDADRFADPLESEDSDDAK